MNWSSDWQFSLNISLVWSRLKLFEVVENCLKLFEIVRKRLKSFKIVTLTCKVFSNDVLLTHQISNPPLKYWLLRRIAKVCVHIRTMRIDVNGPVNPWVGQVKRRFVIAIFEAERWSRGVLSFHRFVPRFWTVLTKHLSNPEN